jgi:hypothetical protein
MAVGYAFFQGTDEALLYDSLKETGDEKNVNRVTGKYFSSQNLAKIFVPFLGAIIARNLSGAEFAILISVDFVGSIISFFLINFITEPNRFMDAAKMRIGIFKDSFKIVFSDKTLFKFSLNRILIFEGAFLYWRVYQVILNKAGITVVVLGLIYFIMQLSMFLALWNSAEIIKKIGALNYIWIPQIVGIICLILSLVVQNNIILFICSIPLLILGSIRDPIFFGQIHVRIPSFNRATVVSALNFIKSVLDIPILLLAGYFAGFDAKYVWVVGLFMLILAVIISPIAKKDIISTD